MLNSGSISGWFLDSNDDWNFLATGLENLAHRALTRYASITPFLFAVGDGNHSLASAKEVWEEFKSAASRKAGVLSSYPCRHVLVEIENIYDPAIHFEPIHRVIFGLGFDETLHVLSALPGFSHRIISGREGLARLLAEPVKGNRFGIASGSRFTLVETSVGGISTASLQPLLDSAVSGSSGSLSADYIHGEDELFRLTVAPGNTGILLPPVQKNGFFETVAHTGPLPRKSFSMGEAEEKRFYIECRKLFG
jgi:hypothetical protein